MRVAVIGAGPAGLAFSDRLISLGSSKDPVVIDIYEKSNYIGGISKTVNYKNNRIDIGGHRFFSKSDEVMSWWANKFPIDNGQLNSDTSVTYRNSSRTVDGFRFANEKEIESGRVLLMRNRKSRILYQRKLYDYPLKLNLTTIKNIGFQRLFIIGISYFKSKLNFKKPTNLEEFIVSRFGKKLYSMFFESYTYKVWGRKPDQISADWGAQRIKGLSIRKVFLDGFKKIFTILDFNSDNSIGQKNKETSLIERFLYPKFGPGQMWEEVASDLAAQGVTINKECEVLELHLNKYNKKISSITLQNKNHEKETVEYDYVISTMPISELMDSIKGESKLSLFPENIQNIAKNLPYRDFITVGLLLNNLSDPEGKFIDDTWIYVQESDVKVGRLQIFNNWSPSLVSDQTKKWVGLEFFCNEGDELWNYSDKELIKLAINEMEKLKLCKNNDFVDGTVLREKKTYPAYFDTYEEFDLLTDKFDEISNLFLIGRNGMHKYNNQDHSMLTGFRAAELIINNKTNKEFKKTLWSINAEKEYHEIKTNK